MAADAQYQSVTYVYKSRGLIARYIQDQAPETYYLDLLNLFEIAENALAPRYGTTIVNRDPDGAPGGQNHLFDAPVVTLAKLLYLNQPYRYAATADGLLWVRNSNLQGPYTTIFSQLSGDPLQYVITNCFQTSQPFIFFYDAAASIKTTGSATPSVIGLDPPSTTATTLPFSPLLTLIDDFGPTNTYTSSGFSIGWAHEAITVLSAQDLQWITDFPEYIGVSNTASGYTGSSYALSSSHLGVDLGTSISGSNTSNYTSPIFLGFPSISLSLTTAYTLAVNLKAVMQIVFALDYTSCTGVINFQYTIDGGVSWTTFYTYAGTRAGLPPTGNPPSVGPTVISTPVSGLTNLANLQVRFTMTLQGVQSQGSPTATLFSNITSISVTTNNSAATDPFDGVIDGMLTVFSNDPIPNPIPIVNVIATNPVDGVYTSLIVNTGQPHGYSSGFNAAIYGSSSPLVDGFFFDIIVRSNNSFEVQLGGIDPLLTFLEATGGVCYAGPEANSINPPAAVIANHYSTPYPSQFSAWGFTRTTRGLGTEQFPIYCWAGTVAQNTTSVAPALVGNTVALDLSFANQVQGDDLIVITMLVDDPAAIDNIRLQFDVRGSGYSSSYYYKDISPAYYQQSVQNLVNAYTATEQQILATTLGVTSGATPGTTTAQLQPGNISTGSGAWAAIYLRRGDFVPVGTAGEPGLDWSAITGWQLVITTNTVGAATVAVNGLYLQWGYGPSSFAGIGYDYRYTYYNINTGTESNPSPEQQFNEQFGWLSSLTKPIYLRQAVQVSGSYSADPQVTHVRIYRRGGVLASNWYQVDQIPNVPGDVAFNFPFIYKDVISDASLLQAFPLVLDNDPPVTSSLPQPISSPLTSTPSSPGQSIYSKFTPQIITVADSTVEFVPNQVIDVGTANNLEQVLALTGGSGQFTAILRLQHNVGELVNVYSTPRAKCNLCELAYGQVWLAGDPNNPHYLYYAKKGLPENFGPQNYIPIGSPNYPIVAIKNWRGTLFVATTQTWWLIPGAQAPPQPTGSIHGAISSRGIVITEMGIMYQASDGMRLFVGADGAYLTLPVEFIFRGTQELTPVPCADLGQLNTAVLSYFNNWTFLSYVALDGNRYRLICDLVNGRRFHYDDLGATAMLWEQDTNQFLISIPIITNGVNVGYAIAYDQQTSRGADDSGYLSTGVLTDQPISYRVQLPYEDLGKPHYPKQWNVLEVDSNTQSQSLSTELFFDTEPPQSLILSPINTGTMRQKEQLIVEAGEGFQAYACSVAHYGISSKLGVLLLQDNIYAALLADYRSSQDSYWILLDYDLSKIIKQSYFDYTSTADIIVNLYVDGDMLNPYFTFTLPPQPTRKVIRQLFPAWKPRMFRMVMTSTEDYQMWKAPTVEWKGIREGQTWGVYEIKMT